MDRKQRKERLLAMISTIQNQDSGHHVIHEDAKLVDLGIIDSIVILDLVGFLEKEFNINFQERGIDMDDFVSIATILDMLEQEIN